MLKDLLRTADLSPVDIARLVELASSLKHRSGRACRDLAGELVALYLTESSPCTERTFLAAATQLGATVVVLGPEEFQRGYGANVTSIARVVNLYASVVVACTDDANLHRLAALATIPVIGGLAHERHPWLSLADLLTRRDDLAPLDGLRLGDVGDGEITHNPTNRSVLTATVDRRVVAPTSTRSALPVLAANRLHCAAAILVALHRRQLVGGASTSPSTDVV